MHEILKNKKVIFFDVGYTLDAPASGDWMFTDRFHALADERLNACAAEDILRARKKGLDYLSANHLIRSEKEETGRFIRYFRIVSDELHLALTDEEILSVAADRTDNMENYVIYPDAKQVLQTLSRTHTLGIISDTWPSIEAQLRTLDIRQYFSFTTYSFDLGVFKPDPRMYLDALSKCGCRAEETVFIDDTPANLEGAARFGITPILIAANPASDVDTPFLKIRSLTELI